MSAPEAFTLSAGTGAAALPLDGGRRRSLKKLRLVKKKTVRRMLARAGLKMGGGDDSMPVKAGRRGSTKKTLRRRRSLFGLKY